MKVIILSLAAVLLSGCVTNFQHDPGHTEYHPFSAHAPDNCVVADSNIIVINGVPSFEYICNKE